MISIIVPVYNTQNYLHKCIQSVIHQTHSDWELILVDDGSSDGSSEICDQYAERYNNISVIHITNNGVSNARNVGIDNAHGEWITFLDSDDWLSSDYIASCCQQEEEDENKLILLPVYRIYWGSGKTLFPNYPEIETVKVEKITPSIADFILEYGTTVGKVYNLKLLNIYGIRFDTCISTHEDHLFYLTYLPYVTSFCFKHSCHYNYILEENNNTTSLSRNLHCYTAYQYAFEQLSMRCQLLAHQWNIPYNKLPNIHHFLLYIKIKTVRSAFYFDEKEKTKKELLGNISRTEIFKWYNVHSINSLMLKITLLMPNIIRIKILKLFKAKLRT